MSLSGQAATAMIAFAPVVAFFAYAIVKAQRKKRAQDQATEPEPPFDSAPEPPPGAWLGHFDAAERTFLRRQFPTVRTCFLVNAWFFAVMLSSGLLPQYVDLAANGQSLAQRVWYSYLQHFSSGSFVCSIVALVSALIAISPLLIPAQASFQRTRPLPRAFQHWSRVLPILGALVASFLAAAACSILLLLALHGPVWKHLLDGSPGAAAISQYADAAKRTSPFPVQVPDWELHLLSPDQQGSMQARRILASLETSPWLMLLSVASSMMLVFSVATALFCPMLHSPKLKAAGAILFWGLFLLNGMFFFIGDVISPRVNRLFFLYARPGPPPPLVFALVPLTASVAFLLLGEFLSSRIEP
jgi:hypothetical protein